MIEPIVPTALLEDLSPEKVAKVRHTVESYKSNRDDGTSEFLFGGMDSTTRVVTQAMILALENLHDGFERTCFEFFEGCYKAGFLTRDGLVFAIDRTSDVLGQKGIDFDTRFVQTFLDGSDIFDLSREKFLTILDTEVSKE